MTIDKIIRACCVCNKVSGGQDKPWYSITDKAMKDLEKFGYKKSHGYCGPQCMSEGSGLDIEECNALYEEIYKDGRT